MFKMFKKLFEFLFGTRKKKFKVIKIVDPPRLKHPTETRPKKCPMCHTENKITRTSKGKWKCKKEECGYEWQ